MITTGTSDSAVQSSLRYNVDNSLADKITNYNRHFAEFSGYFRSTTWLKDVNKDEVTTYFDSVTGVPLFKAPIGRSFDEFVAESNVHGWPSFRDEEVVWENVRLNLNEIDTVDLIRLFAVSLRYWSLC